MILWKNIGILIILQVDKTLDKILTQMQSGLFNSTHRKISKRGSSTLRKTGYEVMKCLKTSKPQDDAVYLFMMKKEKEGKAPKVAKIAGLNKFLKIYYARVKAVYDN